MNESINKQKNQINEFINKKINKEINKYFLIVRGRSEDNLSTLGVSHWRNLELWPSLHFFGYHQKRKR